MHLLPLITMMTFKSLIRSARLWVAALFFLAAVGVARAADAPLFELPHWKSDHKARLEDFAGQIVVLDFFAYWCPPCERTSRELEEKIQKHYAAAGGNPHGVPVRVIAINVEKANPSRTDRFIKRAGCDLVLNDESGKTLEAYGGSGLPLIVVIDGTKAKEGAPRFEIIYQHEGLESTGKLRTIIDGFAKSQAAVDLSDEALRVAVRAALARAPRYAQAGASAETVQADSSEDMEDSIGPPTVHNLEAEFETLFSSDILLTQTGAAYGQKRNKTEWKLAYAYNSIDFDYQPVSFDFLGSPSEVSENRHSAQGSVRYQLVQRLALSGSAGLYEGYTDYRSAWLNEYYRQQFSALPDYIPASPSGYNASLGARWEYLPANGFLQFTAGYFRDEIAPGYEIDFTGLRRGRPYLYSASYALAGENILTKRIRLLNEFRLTDTTGRETRYGYQGSVNVALGEKWVVRALGGYTQEQPQFEAWYAGASVDFEITPEWILSVSGRYYKDTGEIENSLFSSAAPGVEVYQAGLGLRFLWGKSAVKIFAAPMFTRYEPFGIGTQFFQGLYRDRDWGIAQIAYTLEL